MRDEVLAELIGHEDSTVFRIYCHVSGGFVLGTAKWRYNIFCSELPLVLEALRYGDSAVFESNPELDNSPVMIHFQSTNSRFDKVKILGTMADYR